MSEITGISFKIFGFDIIEGMPKTKSYRDLPDHFAQGSYKCSQFASN